MRDTFLTPSRRHLLGDVLRDEILSLLVSVSDTVFPFLLSIDRHEQRLNTQLIANRNSATRMRLRPNTRRANGFVLIALATLSLCACLSDTDSKVIDACNSEGKHLEGKLVQSEGILFDGAYPDPLTLLTVDGFQFVEFPISDRLKADYSLPNTTKPYVRFYLASEGSASCEAMYLEATNLFSRLHDYRDAMIPAGLCLAATAVQSPSADYSVIGKKIWSRSGVEGSRWGVYRTSTHEAVTEFVNFSRVHGGGRFKHQHSCFTEPTKLTGLRERRNKAFNAPPVGSARTTYFSRSYSSAAAVAFYELPPYRYQDLPTLKSLDAPAPQPLDVSSVQHSPINTQLSAEEFLRKFRNPMRSLDGAVFSFNCWSSVGSKPCLVIRERDGVRTGHLPFRSGSGDIRGVQWVIKRPESYIAISGPSIVGYEPEHAIEIWEYSLHGKLLRHYYAVLGDIQWKGASAKLVEDVRMGIDTLEIDLLQFGSDGELADVRNSVQLHDRVTLTVKLPKVSG